MNNNIQNYLVKTASIQWKPLVEGRIDTNGIWVKILRYDEE